MSLNSEFLKSKSLICFFNKNSLFCKLFNIAKQFYKYKNKEIIDHSIEKALNSKLFKKIIIVTNNLSHLKKKKLPKIVKIIKGGIERKGEILIAPMEKENIEVEITNPVFIDPENKRVNQ